MPYQIDSNVWIHAQADRCKGTLIMHLEPGRTYTKEEMIALCANLGLVYTPEQYQQICQILVAEGFVVVV